MNRLPAFLLAAATLTALEKTVKMADLPPAVQKAVQEQTQGATLQGISKEKENGKTQYEVETVSNGLTRDMMIDASGAVTSVEQEVKLDSLPAPAKAAIEKRAGSGKIVKVETVTKGQSVTYEAAVKKGLKTSEFSVNADGSPAR